MWRGVIVGMAVLVVYAYGHPAFNGYRPASLDRAFQSFHTEVNQTARGGKDALAYLDGRRVRELLQGFIGRLATELPKH
jgi:hypothetical protein